MIVSLRDIIKKWYNIVFAVLLFGSWDFRFVLKFEVGILDFPPQAGMGP